MSGDIADTAEIAGFVGSCMVDCDTGLMLTSYGGGTLDLETTSALNSQIVKAQLEAIEKMELDDRIEDILITLGKQFHLIRPLQRNPSVFLCVVLERTAANLGMARLQLKRIETAMSERMGG